MGVSSISGSGYSQAVDPNELFTQWAAKKLHTSGDTVSISDEGRAKAEELAKARLEAEIGLPGMAEEDAQAQGASASGGGGSSAVNKSGEEQAEDLEAKVKALMDQLMNIMQSGLSPEEKMQQAQPIQQMISQLQTQLQDLKTQAAKEKAA